MKEFRHYMPVDIHFGNGRLNDTSLFNMPYHKALIITGEESTQGAQHAFTTLLKALEANNIKYTIDDTITHPLNKKDIVSAVETARDVQCDFIIAFGGGKALDAGKLVARFVQEDLTLLDAWIKSRTVPPFNQAPLFLMSIPSSFNLASAVNPKAFLYDLQNQRQIRFKHETLFPSKAIIDPNILKTLPMNQRFNAIVEAFVRSIELIISEPSLMHTNHGMETLRQIIHNTPKLNKKELDETTLHHLDYALFNLYKLYLPKPWFPLNQISDAIEGYHEQLPNGAFISEAAPIYLAYRLENISTKHIEILKNIFKGTPFESPNVIVSIGYFFNALQKNTNELKKHGLELALVSDYMVHLKTVYPDFEALGNDALYDIIERTLIEE